MDSSSQPPPINIEPTLPTLCYYRIDAQVVPHQWGVFCVFWARCGETRIYCGKYFLKCFWHLHCLSTLFPLSLTHALPPLGLSLCLSTSTLCNWTPSCCVCANSNWQIYLQCWVSQVGARVNAGKWVCLIAKTEREGDRGEGVGCCYSTNYTIATQTAASSLFDRRVN